MWAFFTPFNILFFCYISSVSFSFTTLEIMNRTNIDYDVFKAAECGCNRFLRRFTSISAFGNKQDVLQEAYLIALTILKKDDLPFPRYDFSGMAWKVYYGLIDELRRRVKSRAKKNTTTYVSLDDVGFDFALDKSSDIYSAVESREFLGCLNEMLSDKERCTLSFIQKGYSQTETANILKVSKACICFRMKSIRKKACLLYNA